MLDVYEHPDHPRPQNLNPNPSTHKIAQPPFTRIASKHNGAKYGRVVSFGRVVEIQKCFCVISYQKLCRLCKKLFYFSSDYKQRDANANRTQMVFVQLAFQLASGASPFWTPFFFFFLKGSRQTDRKTAPFPPHPTPPRFLHLP